MFSKMWVCVVVLSFCISHAQGAQISCSWITCGNEAAWDDPSNWDCGVVPHNNETNTFVVTIDARGCLSEMSPELTQNRTIDRLDCYGDVYLEGSDGVELIIQESLINYGNLKIEQLDITGNVMNAESGTLGLEEPSELGLIGDFTNAGGVLVSFPWQCFYVEKGSFTNDGFLRLRNSTVGLDETDANLLNSEGAVIWGSGFIIVENDFVNCGRIISSSGTLQICGDRVINNTSAVLQSRSGSSLCISSAFLKNGKEPVSNAGTIVVATDSTISFEQSISLGPGSPELPEACTLINDANGNIQLQGGTLAARIITQKAGAKFEGFGGITGSVFIDSNGIIKLTGPTNIIGDVNIPAGATLEISDGQTLITGFTDCKGTIRLIGGTVVFQGGCDCSDCNITQEPGTDLNHFDINGDGTVDLRDFAGFADTWLWRASWY